MTENKSNTRLEAFSDGVFAIAITLLILEIKVPPIDRIHSIGELRIALYHLWPSFFAFLYSFGGILIQWVFHHNLMNMVDRTSRALLYTNGFLLLTIVFFPFPTALLAEYINTPYAMPAVVFYGGVSVVNAIAWHLFYRSLDRPKKLRGPIFSDGLLKKINSSNRMALCIYTGTTILAIWLPYVALMINIAVWLRWLSLSLIEEK